MARLPSCTPLLHAGRLLRWMVVASLLLGVGGCSDSKQKSAADRSHYYRMKVGLTYKDKPVDIDFVAGCGVHIGRDLSGSSIHEIASMTDRLRGVRMPEGHAVVINTYPAFESPRFSPCDGDTTDYSSNRANDPSAPDTRVPKDWLPFITWFERDDEFAHGIGYMTQDAYENKNARFGFRYATIEHATKAEFEAFRKTGPANLLPPHQTDSMYGAGDPIYMHVDEVPESVRRNPASGWWKTSGRACRGVVRTALTESQRAVVREAWPKDRPNYWRNPDKQRSTLSSILDRADRSLQVTRYQTSGERRRLPEVFPIAYDRALSRLTPTMSPVDGEDILIGDGASNLGQVFCDDDDFVIFQAIIQQKKQFGCVIRVDGVRQPWPSQNDCGGFDPFFYRDQFVIASMQEFRD